MCNSKGTFFFFSSLSFHNFLKGRRLEHSKFGPRGSGFFFSLPSMVVAFILFYSFFSCTIKQREEKEEGTTNWLNSVRVSKGWKEGGGAFLTPLLHVVDFSFKNICLIHDFFYSKRLFLKF